MDRVDFRASLASGQPPARLSPPLAALWWAAKGDWDRAHELVAADESGREAAWVHGYLHRLEGDAGNARYWYQRAGQPAPQVALDAERDAILGALLDAQDRAA